MNLVWKETLRGRFHRELSFAEKIFTDMDTKQLLLECDCLASTGKRPFNCEVKSATLRHLSTSPEHDGQCPQFRIKKRSEGDGRGKGAKTGPLNPVGGNDWLPDEVGVSLDIGKFCTLSALFNQSKCVTN